MIKYNNQVKLFLKTRQGVIHGRKCPNDFIADYDKSIDANTKFKVIFWISF